MTFCAYISSRLAKKQRHFYKIPWGASQIQYWDKMMQPGVWSLTKIRQKSQSRFCIISISKPFPMKSINCPKILNIPTSQYSDYFHQHVLSKVKHRCFYVSTLLGTTWGSIFRCGLFLGRTLLLIIDHNHPHCPKDVWRFSFPSDDLGLKIATPSGGVRSFPGPLISP